MYPEGWGLHRQHAASALRCSPRQRILSGSVDLLMTDVQMPGLHGLELARRAKVIRPTIAVLYFTGNPELIGDDMGPTLGPVLSKPLPVERLDREITRVHRAQAPSPTAVP
jgi:two-component SAPR family response regulator